MFEPMSKTEIESGSLLQTEGPARENRRTRVSSRLIATGTAVAGLLAVVALSSSPTSVEFVQSLGGIVEFASRKAEDGDSDEDSKCSWGRQNCNATQCCNNAGRQCYYQNNLTKYAQCRDTCTPGPDPSHWDGEPWTCETLGERKAGESKCSAMGEDCSTNQCCQEPNTQCFEKVPGWATCKLDCIPGAPDMSDVDDHHWSCKQLGPRAQGPADWVPSQCSPEGEDCRTTKCCSTAGSQCFEQNGDWASCQPQCTPGADPERSWEPEWSCNELGSRTPGVGPPPPNTVGNWVPKTCGWDGGDCSKSRCCVSMNQQCYEKNEDWAVCKQSCTPGKDPYDNNETWTCKEIGVRSMGLAIKGTPPLLCWSLFQTKGYEMEVMQNQLTQGAGIFQCDEYLVLSTAEPTVIGKDPDGKEVETAQVEMAEITTSVDGTAGNAKLFINCWNVIIEDGRWNNHAWTIKVDPDAVIVPWRLRDHLAPYVLENIYVVNCNKFPSSPNFPMMYGSLEIFSWRAIETYANKMSKCMEDMGMMLPAWGEDYFMTHCLDHIGVGRISDFTSVGDNVCLGANCADTAFAAFHPFKDKDSWQECWNAATR